MPSRMVLSFLSRRRRHTRCIGDWSSDVCSSDLAALRRVATLVARGAPPARVFEAVAAEMRRLFNVESAILVRLDGDGLSTVMAHSVSEVAPLPPGTRLPVRDASITSEVRRTGRPARREGIAVRPDSYGPLADLAEEIDITGAAKAPVIV